MTEVDQPILSDTPPSPNELQPTTVQESIKKILSNPELAPYLAYSILTDAFQNEQDFLNDPDVAVPSFDLVELTDQALASASQIAELQPLSAFQQNENAATICSQLAWTIRNHPDNVIGKKADSPTDSEYVHQDEDTAQTEDTRFQPLNPEFRKKLVDIIGHAVVAADTTGRDNQIFYIINDLLNRTIEFTYNWPPELTLTLDRVMSTQAASVSPLEDDELMDRLDRVELNSSYLTGADLVRLCEYLTQCESSFVTSEFGRFTDVVSTQAAEHTSLQKLFTP